MGFFGGKKNKPASTTGTDRESKSGTERRSRRVVVPGQAGKPAPAAPPPEAPSTSAKPAGGAQTVARTQQGGPAPSGNTGRINRPSGTQSIARPGTNPASKDSGRAKPADEGFMLGGPAVPPRPNTKGPILDSAPPSFTGDLANAGSGPVRSGDAALLEFLVKKAALVSAEQADQAQAKAAAESKPLDVALVQIGALSEDQLVSALTQECWVPHLRVDKYEIRKKALDTIGRDDSVRFSVFPVDKLGSLLTLAMVNPLDAETIRVLETKTGLDIKKVVATRTEIQQGIEKYYSGAVQAKDTSISFTQDVEPKSVTQMLKDVKVKDEFNAPSPISAPRPSSSQAIVPDIQDIDDLLVGDEKVAPAIIDPVGIEPITASEIEAADLEPMAISADEFEPALDANANKKSSSLLDLDLDIGLADTAAVEPALDAAIAKPKPKPKPPSIAAAEFIEDSGLEAAISKPAPRPAAKSTPNTGRPAQPQMVNLVPVMEEEFQHAITHGKAHVFEKWVGLQTRNRIINAIAIEAELEPLLAGLFAAPRRI